MSRAPLVNGREGSELALPASDGGIPAPLAVIDAKNGGEDRNRTCIDLLAGTADRCKFRYLNEFTLQCIIPSLEIANP